MPEEVKRAARAAAEAIKANPADALELAMRMSETFAVGVAAGLRIAPEVKPEAEEVEKEGLGKKKAGER